MDIPSPQGLVAASESEATLQAMAPCVLHVVSSLEMGGMEQFVLRLAAWQRERGLPAGILACRDGDLRASAENAGVPVSVLGRSRGGRVKGLVSAIHSQRPTLIHAHNQPALAYAHAARCLSMITGRRPVPPVVLTFHGQGAHGVRPLRAWERRLTDHTVAVSEGARERLVAGRYLPDPELSGRLSVIANGVREASLPKPASDVRRELRANWGLEDRVVVAIVARVDGRKGHDTLLQAAARLRDLPLTVLVVGDGAAREGLEQLARTLGLGSESVRFLGARSDVAEILTAADLFALPSLSEGLPLSVLEAMSAGLPVVATRVGGLPQLITDGSEGWLVPVGDVAALADAMRTLVVDPERRKAMGRIAQERVRRHFSFDAMGEAYLRLYHDLLGIA